MTIVIRYHTVRWRSATFTSHFRISSSLIPLKSSVRQKASSDRRQIQNKVDLFLQKSKITNENQKKNKSKIEKEKKKGKNHYLIACTQLGRLPFPIIYAVHYGNVYLSNCRKRPIDSRLNSRKKPNDVHAQTIPNNDRNEQSFGTAHVHLSHFIHFNHRRF